MCIETEEQLAAMRRIGRIVALVLQAMMRETQAGVTTRELDALAGELFKQYGARAAPPLMYNFPGNTCISLNNEAAHGVPSERVIRPGDLVNLDVSAELDGFFADSGATVPVAPVTPLHKKLCKSAQAALRSGIASARAGQPLNGIGHAIETIAAANGFTVLRNLCGHGVGRSLHEPPHDVLGFYHPDLFQPLAEGTVLTIEPFLSPSATSAIQKPETWPLLTNDHAVAVQFEHTIVITKGNPIILTAA